MTNYDDTFNNKDSNVLIPTNNLPSIFRLMFITHKVLADNLYMHTAGIFHENTEMTVAWINDEQQYNLAIGMLVTPQWNSKRISNVGQILISNISPNDQPTASLNIFETVPHKWVPVPAIIKFAKSTFEDLPEEFKLLFNAIFWKSDRFYRYLLIPNSLDQQFNWFHGNIMHAIVMAKKAKDLAKGTSKDSMAIVILAALLNDAGMADDFAISNCGHKFEASKRKHLIPNKLTLIEWISAAIAQYDIVIKEDQYLLLLHTLTRFFLYEYTHPKYPIRHEYNILKIAEEFSIGYAGIHNRPRYQDQGIQPTIDKTYFKTVTN